MLKLFSTLFSKFCLVQRLNNIDQWHDTFLNEIEQTGKSIFHQISDADFWEKCLEIYGQGLPFCQIVIDSIKAWFKEETQEKLQESWSTNFLGTKVFRVNSGSMPR